MPLIEWNNAFSVGVQKLDEQHMKFFSMTNRLFDSMRETHNREIVASVLKDLKEYTVEHFKTEESLMKMYNFPDMNKHIQEHQEAIHKVTMFALDYERGAQTVDIDLLKFLSEWLQTHILQTDRQYISYFRGKV